MSATVRKTRCQSAILTYTNTPTSIGDSRSDQTRTYAHTHTLVLSLFLSLSLSICSAESCDHQKVHKSPFSTSLGTMQWRRGEKEEGEISFGVLSPQTNAHVQPQTETYADTSPTPSAAAVSNDRKLLPDSLQSHFFLHTQMKASHLFGEI